MKKVLYYINARKKERNYDTSFDTELEYDNEDEECIELNKKIKLLNSQIAKIKKIINDIEHGKLLLDNKVHTDIDYMAFNILSRRRYESDLHYLQKKLDNKLKIKQIKKYNEE